MVILVNRKVWILGEITPKNKPQTYLQSYFHLFELKIHQNI